MISHLTIKPYPMKIRVVKVTITSIHLIRIFTFRFLKRIFLIHLLSTTLFNYL